MVGLTLIARERSETSEILSWPPLHILAPQGFPRCGCCPKSLWHFPGCLLPPILPHLVDLLYLHLLFQLPVPPHRSQVFPLARGWQGKRGTGRYWKGIKVMIAMSINYNLSSSSSLSSQASSVVGFLKGKWSGAVQCFNRKFTMGGNLIQPAFGCKLCDHLICLLLKKKPISMYAYWFDIIHFWQGRARPSRADKRQLCANLETTLSQFWDNFDQAGQTRTNLTTVRSEATSEITEGSDGEELPPRTCKPSFNNSMNPDNTW